MFVTDALLRKTVAVCQSLGRQGVAVTAGSSTRLAPAFFSRYCRQRVLYPCPRTRPDAFAEMLLDYLGQQPHAVLLPTDDASLLAISRHHEQFAQVTHVPIPTQDQLAFGMDKARTMALADRLGIPHPRTATPASADEARRFAVGRPGGVIVKPRSSSGGRGIAYPAAADEVGAAWTAVHATYPRPLVQERIAGGAKYDVCLLMDRAGRPVASFVQKELRHFPVADGLSTLQESVWRPDLVERAVALLTAIGWYGLAEVEFMEDSLTGETLLLEINPRLWASVQLAMACGVDFPYLLYQVARGQAIAEVHTYAVGRRCRWLLPGDLLHFLVNPQRLRLEPSFFQFGGDTVYDGFYAGDAPATLGVALSCAHYAVNRDLWTMLLRGKSARALPRLRAAARTTRGAA